MIGRIFPVIAVIFGIISALPPSPAMAEPCRDGARNTDDFARDYRAAVRDLTNACTNKSDAACVEAGAALDNALAALNSQNNILKQDCVAVAPPPPPPGAAPKAGDLVIT